MLHIRPMTMEQSSQTLGKIFEKLKIEQKFTPIYSPQCNGRIEGFHKFLKETIVKQLETRVEWDNLVWKATAAYLHHSSSCLDEKQQ